MPFSLSLYLSLSRTRKCTLTHARTKKYKLNGPCSNNQAEQLAIIKTLENLQFLETNDKTALISTDSRITLESLKSDTPHARTHTQQRGTTSRLNPGGKYWKSF